MKTPDLLYVAFIVIALILDHFVLWRRFLLRSLADPGPARVWIWSAWMIMLWTLVAAGVVLWFSQGREWAFLGLTVPYGWRFFVAIGLVLLLVLSSVRSAIKIMRIKRPNRVKMRVGAEKFVPHTKTELAWFIALSLSAGFCEEFIFRGYLIWAFLPVFGLVGAAAFSVVLFAMAHAYQGVKGVIGTGIIGAILTLTVLAFRSLLPAIAVHALIDISQGLLSWLVLRELPGNGTGLPGLSNQPGRSEAADGS